MAIKTLTSKPRENAGNTSNSDRYLDYYVEEEWKIPDGHKVTSYTCSITKIKTASGDFPTDSSVNGNATVNFKIEYTDNSETDMYFVFTDSNQITTTAKTITTSLTNINITGKTIEHFKLYYAYYAGKDKDIKCDKGSYVTLDINYEESAQKVGAPSNVKFASTEVAPNQTVKLTWDAPSNLNGNTKVTYTIYQKNSDGTGTKIDTTTSTEYNNITSSATNGASKTYYITAKGDLETTEVISTNEATLKTVYTAVSGVSNVYINGKASVYVGSINTPTLTLTWSKNDNPHGINNKLQKFEIYKDEECIKTVDANTTSYPITVAGTYQIKAIGQYQNSDLSTNSATLTFINNPVKPNISNYSTKVGSSAFYVWANTSSSDNYEINYNFSYTKKGGSLTNYTNTTLNSLNFPISSYISEGETYTVTITTTLKATDGGYTSASWSSENITRITQFSFNKNWKYYYDPKFSNEANPLSYVWDSVKIGWNAATANTNSGTNFKYDLYYCVGETANWGNPLSKDLTTTSTTLNLSSVPQGATIQIYVKAHDEYGVEAITNTLKLYKISAPKLTTINFNNISYNSIDFSFKWNINTNYTKNLIYSCELCYDGTYGTFITNQNLGHALSSDTKTNSIALTLNSGATAADGSFYKKLYTKVITNQYAKPNGKLRITAYYEGIQDCSTSIEKDFTYDFTTSFSSKPVLSINSQKSFYNPEDSYTIKITAPSWKDAAGGQTGAKLSYTLSGNGKKETLQGTTTSYVDQAPLAEKDNTLSYELTATLTWKDATVSTKVNSPLKVEIARWSSNDSVTLSSLKRSNEKASGSLNIAGTLCGSSKFNNVSSVIYNIYSNGSKVLENQNFGNTKSSSTISKTFSFNDTSKEQTSIYAEVIFTNTSNKKITKTTAVFIIKPEGVPFAIRKGRIGINVDSTSFKTHTSESSNSALYVIAANENAPVLDLDTINSGNKYIDFKNNGTTFASLRKGSNYLYLDNTFRSLGGMIIDGSTNANGEETNPYLSFVKKGTGRLLGNIAANRNTGQLYFVQRNLNENAQYEYYYLPTTSDAGGTYNILTTKRAVTLQQGGTGGTDRATAIKNLWYIGDNIITSPTNDTTSQWSSLGFGSSFYFTANQITDQPSTYGILVNLGRNEEVFQLWHTQAIGDLYYRGGNGSGWNDATWRKILDSNNYSNYTLPISGGTLSGSIKIAHATNAIMDSTTTNPRITFSENGAQEVGLVYTDYNNYRSPAGLKVIGIGSDASPAWFEAEGEMYANGGNLVLHAGNYTRYTNDRVVSNNIRLMPYNYNTRFGLQSTDTNANNTLYLYTDNVETGNIGYITYKNGSWANSGTFYTTTTSTIRPVNIELQPPTNAGHGGYIDFHHNGSTADYTSRIIEYASGQITLDALNGVYIQQGSGNPGVVHHTKNIIYGTSTPTSGYQGQIWLKPKK